MDMKKASETRLEQLLSVKKKLCKEQAFDEIVPNWHRDILSALFAALDDAIGSEVQLLGGGANDMRKP